MDITRRRDRTMNEGEGSGRKLRGSAHDMIVFDTGSRGRESIF